MIAAFSITPLGAGESVGGIVAECVRIVRASGLANETNSMFTNVEGPYDEVMSVIKACVDHVTSVAPRASVVVKMDVLASDPGGRLAAKVQSVERHLEG
ncbi:MAG TPA: MTH1187 family thiamine-binding protein [Acidimicrobiales bacterium]|nr:MTH1187 family thiamine-binding protein [Acidimicrobiales bacterium]